MFIYKASTREENKSVFKLSSNHNTETAYLEKKINPKTHPTPVILTCYQKMKLNKNDFSSSLHVNSILVNDLGTVYQIRCQGLRDHQRKNSHRHRQGQERRILQRMKSSRIQFNLNRLYTTPFCLLATSYIHKSLSL